MDGAWFFFKIPESCPSAWVNVTVAESCVVRKEAKTSSSPNQNCDGCSVMKGYGHNMGQTKLSWAPCVQTTMWSGSSANALSRKTIRKTLWQDLPSHLNPGVESWVHMLWLESRTGVWLQLRTVVVRAAEFMEPGFLWALPCAFSGV